MVVHRSYEPLAVDCKKNGYKNASMRIKSHTKGMSFGNIIFGGVVGAGVDMVNGSAYDYPVNIVVPMDKANPKNGSQRR